MLLQSDWTFGNMMVGSGIRQWPCRFSRWHTPQHLPRFLTPGRLCSQWSTGDPCTENVRRKDCGGFHGAHTGIPQEEEELPVIQSLLQKDHKVCQWVSHDCIDTVNGSVVTISSIKDKNTGHTYTATAACRHYHYQCHPNPRF